MKGLELVSLGQTIPASNLRRLLKIIVFFRKIAELGQLVHGQSAFK
jgi:hypothetical protein